jgi:hypothetical protein
MGREAKCEGAQGLGQQTQVVHLVEQRAQANERRGAAGLATLLEGLSGQQVDPVSHRAFQPGTERQLHEEDG